MENHELLFRSAEDLAALIKSGKATSVQVVSAHLAQIRKHNSWLHAVVTLREQEALAEAAAADRAVAAGEQLGPLHGVPITFKDSYRVNGIRSTFGALPQYRKHIPKSDCELIRRLRDSGAIFLGRTNVPLLSFDWQCSNPIFKECVNPWNPKRVPGGSSGGSAAAVAAGFTPLELESDIAGSIRYPAHCCGILGLRTTDGLLPIDDIGPEELPQAFHRIVTCGPMGRSIADLRLMLSVLSRSETAQYPTGNRNKNQLRIALATSLLGVEPNQRTRSLVDHLAKCLQADGHDVHWNEVPQIDFTEAYRIWGAIAGYEMKAVLPPFFRTQLGRELFDGYVFHYKMGNGPLTKWFKRGLSSTPTEYENALKERDRVISTVDSFFNSYDLWILPVSPAEAITRQWGGRSIQANEKRIPYSEYLGSYLAPTAVLGTPALSLPIGFGDSNLPIGIQIHGPRFADPWLLEMAEKHLAKYIDLKVSPLVR